MFVCVQVWRLATTIVQCSFDLNRVYNDKKLLTSIVGKARVPLSRFIPLTAIAGEARDWRRRLNNEALF